MWGKKTGLIDPFKMSSYGLILMLLYFLMKTGMISFIEDPYQPIHVEIRKKYFFYDELLENFMSFYLNGSFFYLNKEMICLIKGC